MDQVTEGSLFFVIYFGIKILFILISVIVGAPLNSVP